MENMTIVTGHKNPDTDSICCALTYTYVKQQLGVPAVACRAGKVSKETQYVLDAFKMEAPKLIEEVEPGQKLILVDHNEESQAVDGLADADLKEVIDHHRLGGLKTAAPLYMRVEPLGCCSTIIAKLAKEMVLPCRRSMQACSFLPLALIRSFQVSDNNGNGPQDWSGTC